MAFEYLGGLSTVCITIRVLEWAMSNKYIHYDLLKENMQARMWILIKSYIVDVCESVLIYWSSTACAISKDQADKIDKACQKLNEFRSAVNL